MNQHDTYTEKWFNCAVCGAIDLESNGNITTIGIVCKNCYPTYIHIAVMLRKKLRKDVISHLQSIERLI